MTIKQIADLCGVSRGTVDRVLNGRGKVKPETEERVLHTIQQLGYTKNIAGKALTLKKTAPVIGVVVSSEGNPFFNDVIEGFLKAEADLKDYGVTLIVKTMRGYDVNRQLALIAELETANLSALVIQPINDVRISHKINELGDRGIPTVTVNTDIEKKLPQLLCWLRLYGGRHHRCGRYAHRYRRQGRSWVSLQASACCLGTTSGARGLKAISATFAPI